MRFKLKLMSGRLKRKMYGETIEYRATRVGKVKNLKGWCLGYSAV